MDVLHHHGDSVPFLFFCLFFLLFLSRRRHWDAIFGFNADVITFSFIPFIVYPLLRIHSFLLICLLSYLWQGLPTMLESLSAFLLSFSYIPFLCFLSSLYQNLAATILTKHVSPLLFASTQMNFVHTL